MIQHNFLSNLSAFLKSNLEKTESSLHFVKLLKVYTAISAPVSVPRPIHKKCCPSVRSLDAMRLNLIAMRLSVFHLAFSKKFICFSIIFICFQKSEKFCSKKGLHKGV